MSVIADRTPGVSIEVDDLVEVRNRLAGLAGTAIRQQASDPAGAHELRMRGPGMEYAESRAYVSGDDVRTMDWRVMARTGEAHTKIFTEEKDRCCLIAVDLSASMFYGTRVAFKSWAAAQVAAHAGWMASFAGERIGGLVAAGDYHGETRPSKSSSGLFDLFHHLSRAADRARPQSEPASRLGMLLRELNRVSRPGVKLVVVSDFLGIDESSLQALSNISRHNQVTACWIFDDSEVNEWPRGHYPVFSGQQELLIDLDDEERRAWLKLQQQQHRERVEGLCRNFNMLLKPISCNHDITSQYLRDPEPRK